MKWVAQPSTLIHKQVSKLKTNLFASQMAVSVTLSPDTGNMAVNTFVQNKKTKFGTTLMNMVTL